MSRLLRLTLILFLPRLLLAASDLPPIKVATTTSLENSGVLAELTSAFTRASGIRVLVVAVGTGQALKLGERGDVDLVLTHDPEAEERFVREGFGVRRVPFMQNDYLLVGPPSDPARVRNTKPADAMRAIWAKKAGFVSRGDDSGTHRMELRLWRQAGLTPKGNWYLEAGQGMAGTLMMADEKGFYTLSDRATFLSFRDKIRLVPLVEHGPGLINIYSAIPVSPAKHTFINHDGAQLFLRWLLSTQAKGIIAEFKRDGIALFHPLAP